MANKEIQFLDGPQSRWKEFTFTISVFVEFIKGFRALHFAGPCVAIFGSARFTNTHPYYTTTEKIAEKIAQLGFTIMTGGGPGLMEAANKGAKNVGGKSVGCNIILPHEQHQNPYLDKWVNIKYFFVRKTLLIKYSYAFIVMPGGFGTMDELFEALTLIQTKMISQFPVVIFDTTFHTNLINHINLMKEQKTIGAIDTHLFLATDNIDEAVNFIQKNTIKQFNLQHQLPTKKPLHWLFEKN
jgi:uncharacterized protein (TIGR00730 family)